MAKPALYKLTGDDATLLTGEDALCFYESKSMFVEDAEKHFFNPRIPYDSIYYVSKEEKSKSIYIRYRNSMDITSGYYFRFIDKNDYRCFFNFLQSELQMTKVEEAMLPKEAIRDYYFPLVIAACVTVIPPFLFNTEKVNPVLYIIITGALTTFVILKMVRRYKCPPRHIKFSKY